VVPVVQVSGFSTGVTMIERMPSEANKGTRYLSLFGALFSMWDVKSVSPHAPEAKSNSRSRKQVDLSFRNMD
jgi:hypothetical protein